MVRRSARQQMDLGRLKKPNGAAGVAVDAGIGGGRGEAAGRIPAPRLSNLRAGGADRRPVRLSGERT